MYPFADRLEDFDVNGGCTAVVTIVFKFLVPGDALRTLGRGQNDGRATRYAGHDRADVEG